MVALSSRLSGVSLTSVNTDASSVTRPLAKIEPSILTRASISNATEDPCSCCVAALARNATSSPAIKVCPKAKTMVSASTSKDPLPMSTLSIVTLSTPVPPRIPSKAPGRVNTMSLKLEPDNLSLSSPADDKTAESLPLPRSNTKNISWSLSRSSDASKVSDVSSAFCCTP